MMSFPTPIRGLVCNISPAKKDDKDGKDPKDNIPSVEQAKKNTEQAKLQEKAAIEKEQQQQMFTTAMDKSRAADESTKAALKYKPDSTQGKKAHHAAAVAHKDAYKHMTGVGGEKSGLANDQRAAAERKAAKHKKMAETHAAMAEGFGGPGGTGKGPTKNSTGCPGVGVEINGLVQNMDVATRAKEAEGANSTSSHIAASDYHAHMWGNVQHHPEAMAAHEEAMHTHKLAFSSLKARGRTEKGGVESSRARAASKRANAYKV